MSFRVLDALPILIDQYGETINRVPVGKRREGLENKKIMGFRTSTGKVVALDVYPGNMDRVRLWIETLPPSLFGVSVLKTKKCADLEIARLSALSKGKGIYLEAKSRQELLELLQWY